MLVRQCKRGNCDIQRVNSASECRKLKECVKTLKFTTFDSKSVGEFEATFISGKGSGNHKFTGYHLPKGKKRKKRKK